MIKTTKLARPTKQRSVRRRIRRGTQRSIQRNIKRGISGIQKDFPILSRRINGRRLVYLDNASTTQKPAMVIKATDDFYAYHNANVHRSVYTLAEEATALYEGARGKIARFINASPEEVIFTRGTTESMNLLARSLLATISSGDIVISRLEHHSNLVPWQQLAKQKGLGLKYIELDKEFCIDLSSARNVITKKTRIVAITHISNVTGAITPLKSIVALARAVGAIVVVDGAQSVPHIPVDVKKLDFDFLAFSGHKMLGPTGIGVLYGKKELLEKIPPFMYGGDMISEVTYDDASWNDLPWKFEAGTPHLAGAIGLGAAVAYLESVGMHAIEKHERALTVYAMKKLAAIPGVVVYGTKDTCARLGVISFNLGGAHPHDVATILDRDGIAVRGGHHCAMPLMGLLNVNSTVRASFALYNTKEDVDALVTALWNAKEVLKV